MVMGVPADVNNFQKEKMTKWKSAEKSFQGWRKMAKTGRAGRWNERKIGLFYNICMKINKITKPKYFRFKGLFGIFVRQKRSFWPIEGYIYFVLTDKAKLGIVIVRKAHFVFWETGNHTEKPFGKSGSVRVFSLYQSDGGFCFRISVRVGISNWN